MSTLIFSDNQLRALRALVEHGSTTAAAESTGLSERTIRRYREDPEFAAELSRLRGAALSECAGELLAATSEAVQALRRGLTAATEEGEQKHHVQVRAARAILELTFRGTELADLEERIAALEEEFSYG